MQGIQKDKQFELVAIFLTKLYANKQEQLPNSVIEDMNNVKF